jgi:threonine dehydratase
VDIQIPDFKIVNEFLKGKIHRTPVLSSSLLNTHFGSELFFKAEPFQRGGSFKIRGALWALHQQMQQGEITKIGTHSSGNFAQAIAIAGKQAGLETHIVMPENSPQVKIAAVKGYGATVHLCESTIEARESTLANLVDKLQLTPFHPYDDWDIMAGQGTAALELLEEVPDLDYIIAPVGGGGLISGTLMACKDTQVKVLGAEPVNANDAYRGLLEGERITQQTPHTCADGLRTLVGVRNFAVMQGFNLQIRCVTEEEILAAQNLLLSRLKVVVETSSASTLASLMAHPIEGKKVGLILSGGNVDF